MTSRDKILNSIASNKPALKPLPALPQVPIDVERFVKTQKFITVLKGIGGHVFEDGDKAKAIAQLNSLKNTGKKVACLCPETGQGNFTVTSYQTAIDLEAVDTVFINGSYGVAENGAVWLYESQFINRLLPFICQHLVIILNAENILSDMHEAYRLIDVAREGYGLFLAGPSKTADIEQSLVIGAHGARSATIYLVNVDNKYKY